MDKRILLLMALGLSLLIFGCAGKKGPAAPADGLPPASDGGPTDVNDTLDDGTVSDEDKELADLFRIDTDKPLEGEGFDVKSPSAQNES